MAHDWVFDVLRDLRSYAEANGLAAFAGKIDEATKVATAEIAAGKPADEGEDPPPGLRH